MIQLKEVNTNKLLRAFVSFPFSLYKNNPYWVPPIIKEEMASFNPAKNPVFKHATARFFLAQKHGKTVGRIAAIINHTEVNVQGIKKMRFGWFDFIDDLEVSKCLLDKVCAIGLENQLSFMEGPVGFSNLDKVGVLTEGFDHIGTMITWYNHPYYQDHFTKLGFLPEKQYVENKFLFKNVDPKALERTSELVQKRYQVRGLGFGKTKNLLPYVDEMFDLFNKSYASLSSFVPISAIEKAYLKDKYIRFINPEYINFVLDKTGKIIAFAIIMPSFSRALQKARGKLFPFGFWHLLQAKKNSKDIITYLIGVDPAYQKKGVIALLMRDLHRSCEKNGVVNCIRTPELVDNKAIAAIWKHYNPQTHKRRCTYRKDL
ncbi:MAG: GNAT family N-acetyltransferase [Lutibacter sp.]|jgi:GNAT superfamily N-acetyltransferase|nr:GNAT family N-acetyltransferase [Lutibacter sp.]